VKNLCIILSARNCNVGHAVVEQILRAEFGIDVYEHALCGLPLAGVARHGVAVVNVRMLLWVDGDTTRAVQFEAHPSISTESLHGSKFTIGNLQLIVWRRELDTVANRKSLLLSTIGDNAHLSARIVGLLASAARTTVTRFF